MLFDAGNNLAAIGCIEITGTIELLILPLGGRPDIYNNVRYSMEPLLLPSVSTVPLCGEATGLVGPPFCPHRMLKGTSIFRKFVVERT